MQRKSWLIKYLAVQAGGRVNVGSFRTGWDGWQPTQFLIQASKDSIPTTVLLFILAGKAQMFFSYPAFTIRPCARKGDSSCRYKSGINPTWFLWNHHGNLISGASGNGIMSYWRSSVETCSEVLCSTKEVWRIKASQDQGQKPTGDKQKCRGNSLWLLIALLLSPFPLTKILQQQAIEWI